MFRIGICDDQRAICSQIEGIILENQNTFVEQVEIDVFYSGERLAEFIQHEHDFDMVFLDIEMEGLNGLDLGLKIREEMDNQTMQIVYVSGRESYYKDLFEVRPMHFLSKPIEAAILIKDINLAMKLNGCLGGVFCYRKAAVTYKIPIREILYFQSVNREIKITTITGEDMFYGKLRDVYLQLEGDQFMKIHKSYLVNYEHAVTFKYDEVRMSNSDCLPISQLKRKEIRALQLRYEIERLG